MGSKNAGDFASVRRPSRMPVGGLVRAMLVIASAACVVQTGCKREASPAAVRSAVPAETSPAASPATGEVTAVGGFARLEAATKGLPPNPLVGNAARLARARAWTAQHSADRSARQRELQAQMIATIETLLGDEVTLEGFSAIQEFELLEIWSRDSDGDGVLSEDEAIVSEDVMQQAVEDSLLYFADRFDTDGNGSISDIESSAADSAIETRLMPILGMLIDRAQMVEWDENADGVLSGGELGAGQASLGIDPDDPRLAEDASEARFALYGSITSGFESASQLLDVSSAADRPEIEEFDMPSPRRGDFDFDGDGELSSVEARAFEEESASWSAAAQDYSRRVHASYAIGRHRSVARVMDLDGDGRIDDREWIEGTTAVRRERDKRIFRYLYDSDRDGGFSDSEVLRFMNAYDRKSIYADVDLNGRVDVNDVVLFRDRVLGQ